MQKETRGAKKKPQSERKSTVTFGVKNKVKTEFKKQATLILKTLNDAN